MHSTIFAAVCTAEAAIAIPASAHAAVPYNDTLRFPRHFESLSRVLLVSPTALQKHINGLSQSVMSRPDSPRHHEAPLVPDIAAPRPSVLHLYFLSEIGFSAP